jgi:hypothetical protein
MKIQSAKVGAVPGCAEGVGLFICVKPFGGLAGRECPCKRTANDIRKYCQFGVLNKKLKIKRF